jgi:cell division protein FtsI/penicillin-binding protein 2
VITTALALQQGLKVGDSVNCSPNATVEGQIINNDSGLRAGIQNATLKDAFEQSCNTAFVNLAMDGKLGSDYSALANEAKTYFGMDQKWDLGMGPATYGTPGDQQVKPADGKGLFARDAFGQGNITMSPLTMASVAATVCAGQFKQPILVPGTQQISATPLPGEVDSQLTTLMQAVVTSPMGTGNGIFPGISGIAAKTGSAESNDSAKTGKTDSWMIVFDKSHDIAFGALVLNGGFGREAAGPAIDKALNNLGYH